MAKEPCYHLNTNHECYLVSKMSGTDKTCPYKIYKDCPCYKIEKGAQS